MSTFETPIYRFTPPNEWNDRSMVVWSAPESESQAAPANVMILQDTLEPELTLNQYVNAQESRLLNSDDSMTIEQHQPIEWCGKPAVELILMSKLDGQSMKQRQVFVSPVDGELLLISFTAPASQFAHHLASFDHVEQSFQWKPRSL